MFFYGFSDQIRHLLAGQLTWLSLLVFISQKARKALKNDGYSAIIDRILTETSGENAQEYN